ncbi:MAG: TetR/AcrR family transcriptional regulator [Epibacterium sp.]|nr:TetR/AcrR family transcriptional regulator [Epibacterium sp.]NQX75335.1 TetR/AcrR family transcriptional regulator [Epibacterium sp.]
MATENKIKQRGSRDIWLKAAYDLLISDGIDAVKVMTLARRLNLTRTGFYWFFKDLADLHSAMIKRWESKNTGNLIAMCGRETASVSEAMFNLMDCWLDRALFDAPLDLAIRNWGRINPELQAKIDAADAARIAAVSQIFERFGYSKEQSEVRGMTVIYTQIGYISMDVEENPTERLARVQHYVELFTGVRATDAEVDSFLERHGPKLT